MPDRKSPDPSAPAPKSRSARAKSADFVSITKAAGDAPAARVAKAEAASPDAKSPAKVPAARQSGNTLRLKDLTERVEALTGGKKKAVRQTVEAVLTILGHALMAGDDLNLPPLGRARVSRQRDREDGEILIIRLKRATPDPDKTGKAAARKSAKEALAAKPEES